MMNNRAVRNGECKNERVKGGGRANQQDEMVVFVVVVKPCSSESVF